MGGVRESADDQHPVGRSELGERQRLEASEQLSDSFAGLEERGLFESQHAAPRWTRKKHNSKG